MPFGAVLAHWKRSKTECIGHMLVIDVRDVGFDDSQPFCFAFPLTQAGCDSNCIIVLQTESKRVCITINDNARQFEKQIGKNIHIFGVPLRAGN